MRAGPIWGGVKQLFSLRFLAGFGSALCFALVAGLAVASMLIEPPKRRERSAGMSHSINAPLAGWGDVRLIRRPGEPPLEFAARANQEIFLATWHCDFDERRHSLPAYLAASWWGDDLSPRFRKVGYLHPEIITCGFCHQRAFIAARTMLANGLQGVRVLGLNGHVVATFETDGQTLIVDPDYGVGPFRIDLEPERVEHRVSQVESAYRQVFDILSERTQRTILASYADTTDDRDYGDVRALDAEANKQLAQVRRARAAILMAGGALALIGVLLAAFAFGLFRRRKVIPPPL